MSADNYRPDVVVVGMPSCGKTVFFTVLGKKFTSVVEGHRVAPLGFRLSTCDEDTGKVVDGAYDRLCNGLWPKATETGLTTSLRWEVSTGWRRIFELYSMDIAGETFKRAFGVKDDGDEEDAKRKSQKTSKKSKDTGSELYQSGVTDGGESSRSLTAEEREADNLKAAIVTAKVVCFMINVALPVQQGGKTLGESEQKKIQRFRSSVRNIYHTLKDQKGLREKSIIVLTQTHLHTGEIERVGGPVMYLAHVHGSVGAELCNLARKCNIPVIAVSAINEDRDSNELPPISSPGDIHSSGLFGFLLMVAGRVAKEDPLAEVMATYCEYQRERVEYLRHPALEIKSRLRLARKYWEASDKYVKACERYLDTPENFAETPEGALLSADDLRLYRRCSNEDEEIRSAMDREYLVRDELWDRALRKAVISKWNSRGQEPDPNVICGEVYEGMTAAFTSKRGNATNDEFVYGFSEDELFSNREASSFGKWIKLNVGEYWDDLERNVSELTQVLSVATTAVDEMFSAVGTNRFATCRQSAEEKRQALVVKIDSFNKNWQDIDDPTVMNVMRQSGEIAVKINDAKNRHEHALSDNAHKRRMEEVEQGISKLREEVNCENDAIGKMKRAVGTDEFTTCMMATINLHGAVGKRLKSASSQWQKVYGILVPELPKLESEWNALAEKIMVLRKRNADIRAQKKRRQQLLALVMVIIIAVALTLATRLFYLECNRRSYEAIKSFCEQGEFQNAVKTYGEMYEIPLFGVSRDKYFASGFDKRLADVSGINDARRRISGLRDLLTKIESADDFAKLRLPDKIVESIKSAHRVIDDCLSNSSGFSFDAIRLGSAPIAAEQQKLAKCETSLKEVLPAVDLACQDARLNILCDEADALLKACETEVSDGDEEAAITVLDKAEGTIGGALPHKGCSDTVKRRLEETKGKVTQLGARLKASKVNSLVGSAREHADAKRWVACKENASKALALDPLNSDAVALEALAERAISAKQAADQAENESRKAMTEAMLSDAPKWAEKEWSLGEGKRNAAKVKYEAGEYSDASDLFWESKNAYVEAGEAAKENSAPKVKIVAKLNGAVKNATITNGLTLDDYGEMFSGRKTEGTIVLLKNSEVGELHEFKIEYEENVTRYVGSGLYRVEKGLNEFVIDLKYKDTLKWNRRRCGHCGASLEEYPHVYKCPKCQGVIKADAFEQ